jgi:hypothetical protein
MEGFIMKSLIAKIIGIFVVCALAVNTVGFAQAKTVIVNTKTVKNHKEKDILKKLKKDTICSFYVTAKKELRAFTAGEDGVPAVYKWTGKEWKDADNDPLRDFTYNVNKKNFTGYTAPSVNKKGTAYYIANKTKIYKYNQKGKVLAQVNLKKKLKLNATRKYISQIIWLKADWVAINTWQMGGTSAGIYVVDLKKKKTVQLPLKYTALMAGNGKYIYLKTGDASAETEQINKVNAITGKCVKKIKTANLRILGADCMIEDEDYGLLKNTSLSACVNAGKLYVKYLTGVYVWNEKKSRFDQIVDGSKNFGAGKLYGGIMQFTDKNKLYIMGNKTDDNGPTNFYEYRLS